jgi:hypothetical protein
MPQDIQDKTRKEQPERPFAMHRGSNSGSHNATSPVLPFPNFPQWLSGRSHCHYSSFGYAQARQMLIKPGFPISESTKERLSHAFVLQLQGCDLRKKNL